jgi:hypothetical protein
VVISKSQLSVIHLAKRRLGLDDDTYRDVLKLHGGVESAEDLDDAGFDRVMDYFARLGFKSSWRERTFGNRAGMATPPQIDKIRDLWRAYTGGDDERTLNRWLEHYFKVTTLRFLTKDVAQKAITALLRMTDRAPAKAEGGTPPSPAA